MCVCRGVGSGNGGGAVLTVYQHPLIVLLFGLCPAVVSIKDIFAVFVRCLAVVKVTVVFINFLWCLAIISMQVFILWCFAVVSMQIKYHDTYSIVF